MKHGIDVADPYQRYITSAVVGDFVIVKATEYTTYKNPSMEKQLMIKPLKGLYHFATGGDVIAEANHFLNTVKPYIGKAILALDYEATALTMWGVSQVKQWLDYVYNKTGVKPYLYMSLATENAKNWSSVADKYPLWVAQYNNAGFYTPIYGYQPRKLNGSLKYWKEAKIFQYASYGILNGYTGRLDLNVCYDDWDTNEKAIDTGEDFEMTWHPYVRYDTKGIVKVNNEDGAPLYSNSNLTGDPVKKLDYGSSWQAFEQVGGAINLGGNQWVNSKDVIAKWNQLAYNTAASAIGIVIPENGMWTQNEMKPSQGIKYLKTGERYLIFGRTDKYLNVGGEADGKYASGDNMYIVL